MSVIHRTYPNPTIVEAVCDIHFRLSPDKAWKSSLAGELFKHIQDEYPEMEPILEMGLQLEVGPSGASTKILPQPQKVRFKHKSHTLVLQLGESSFSISTLASYQGWEVMRDNIFAAWKQAEKVLQPEVISRIGLRYINRFDKETSQDRLSDWLVATDDIPNSLLHSEPGFFLRSQVHLSAENTLIITLGDTGLDADDTGYGSIVFDIDRILEKELTIKVSILEKVLDSLHVDVWNIFSSAIGEKLQAFLEGRRL